MGYIKVNKLKLDQFSPRTLSLPLLTLSFEYLRMTTFDNPVGTCLISL